MAIYAIGVRVDRGVEKGYYLLDLETQQQRYLSKEKTLQVFKNAPGMSPVSNLVLADGILKCPWQGREGLIRYDKGGNFIGSYENEKGVYLTSDIITENCEPPIGIGHWEVQVYKNGAVQGFSGYEAVQLGFDCIRDIMADEMPVDGEVASFMHIIDDMGGSHQECDGIEFDLEMTPRGLLTIRITDVTPDFSGSLKIDVKCKAILDIDASDFPNLIFKDLIIGSNVGQICKGALEDLNIVHFIIEPGARYTIDVALESNAKYIDLTQATGLIERKRSYDTAEFGARTESLKMPKDSGLIVYPTRNNRTLKELQLGSQCSNYFEREVERYRSLEHLLLPDSRQETSETMQEDLRHRHLRGVEVSQFALEDKSSNIVLTNKKNIQTLTLKGQ